MIALRVVNSMNSQQGGTGASATEETDTDMANTEEPAVSECYLGFDVVLAGQVATILQITLQQGL